MKGFPMLQSTGPAWICTLLLAVISPYSRAQDPDVDLLRTRGEAQLRVAPNAEAPIAFTVPADTDLTWVVRSKHAGYYRVLRQGKGPQAWIATEDADIVHKAGKPPEAKVCAATLDQCPVRGCEQEGTPAAESNELKRRQPRVGVPVTLNFEDFARLQDQADALIGQGPPEPTAEQRGRLRDLSVKQGRVSEGDLVRAIGYIATGGQGLHANKSGESVNCQLKKPVNNDFHIPLVDAPGNSEFTGIVVEMIPQDRPPAWSIDALKEIQAKGLKVWAEGGLSYDKVHYVNRDPDHPLKDEPDRMSLWEIHPITKFLVCRKPHCDPQAEEDWTPLNPK